MKLLLVPEGCTDLPAVREWLDHEARNGPKSWQLAASYGLAAANLLSSRYDAVLCDLTQDEDRGLDLVLEVRARADPTPFLLITERESAETVARRVQTLGRAAYLVREELSAQKIAAALRGGIGTSRTRGEETPRQRIANIAPAMIWKTDTDGMFTGFSRRWCIFTGRSEEKERGSGWLDGVHPGDLADWVRLYSSALRERREFGIDIRMRSAGGDFRWVRHHGIPCFTAEGGFSGYVGSSFDITDLKQAHQQALAEVGQLALANRELESFVTTACHDLHEPLRTLKSQLRVLTEEPAVSGLLAEAMENVQRMQTLLHDLLECARISTRGQPLEPTHLSAPLDWALANLSQRIAETAAEITREPLPIVDADATQIAQIFQNLIGNALKFRRGEPVLVHVGAHPRDDGWCFFVRDNGLGIDPDHHEKIFGLFERVPGRKPEGRGIGLTICKKIVERHRGRIWVESEPDKGSTFFFWLPGTGREG